MGRGRGGGHPPLWEWIALVRRGRLVRGGVDRAGGQRTESAGVLGTLTVLSEPLSKSL